MAVAKTKHLSAKPSANSPAKSSVKAMKPMADAAKKPRIYTTAFASVYPSKITGVICGYRVEGIEDKLMQKIRYLDKLVDALSKGKAMEAISRR